MKIEYKGKAITNILDWEKLIFIGKKKKHWKVGKSAHAIANFVLRHNGKHLLIKKFQK